MLENATRLDVAVLLIRTLNKKVKHLERDIEDCKEKLAIKNKHIEETDSFLNSLGYYKCNSCGKWVYETDIANCEGCDLCVCFDCPETIKEYDNFFGCQNCYDSRQK